MALIRCPECDGRVSNYADICPHCGYDIASYLNKNLNTGENSKDYSQNCPQVLQYSLLDNQHTNDTSKKKNSKRDVWIASAILIPIVMFFVFVAIDSNKKTQDYLDETYADVGVQQTEKSQSTPTPKATTYKSSKSSYGSYKSSSYSSTEREVCAQLHAEAFVKKYLKSPSTAKFPKCNEYIYDLSSDIWLVSGYVDAQNSFGAITRQYFIVSFTVSSDLNNATLVTIDFF